MPAVPCVDLITKASDGRIGRLAAKRLLRTLGDQVNERMRTTGEARPIAAAFVHQRAEAREAFRAAKAERNALRDAQITDSLFNEVLNLSTGRKKIADKLHDIVGQRYSLIKAMDATQQGRYMAALVQSGVGEFYTKITPAQARDVFFAVFDAQAGRPSTVSPEARKVADTMFSTQREQVSAMNKEGADVALAEGRGLMQTHDIAKLRAFGDKVAARNWWMTFVKSQNVNWERTLEGSPTLDRDEFLTNFFNDIYDGVHPNQLDHANPADFLPGGSLANKASSSRVLWFGDAVSSWNYMSEMGLYGQDVRRLFQAEIRAATRTIVMLRSFGTRPDQNYQKLVHDLIQHAHNSDLPDSDAQAAALKGTGTTNALSLLDGRSESPDNIHAQTWIDNIKAWVLASKGGGFGLTAFITDRTGMATQMHHMGATVGEIAMQQLDTVSPNTPAGRELLERLGMQGEAMTHAIREWWQDMRVNRWTMAATQKMFDWTGLTKVTDSHRSAVAKTIGFMWGRDAGTAFADLPKMRRFFLEKYNIGEAEWNAIRRHAFDVDDHKALSPDLAQSKAITDAEIDAATGVSTPESRERWRNDLEAKMVTYLRQNVDAAMNQPGFTERDAFTLHGQKRGTFGREGMELIGMLKGFPFAVFNRTRERARELGGARTPAFIMQVSGQLASSVIAGYTLLTVKDRLNGRTRRKLVDDDGNVNWSVFGAAFYRGGGVGIYGDFLFGEYDRRYRTALGAIAGPALGQVDPIFAMATKAKNLFKGDVDENAESLGYDALRFSQENLPFINMFYVKPLLDHFIFWHLKEGLSPGVFRRTQQNVEDNNYQEFWIEPSVN